MATRSEQRLVAQLKAHPASERVFGHLGPDEFDDLRADIEKRGLRHPLELDAKERVVCGGERLRALRDLGWQYTTVLIHDHLVIEEDCLEELLLDNLIRRQLLPSQMYRAGKELEAIEAVRARKRLEAGVKADPTEKGRSEKHAAKKIGTSQSNFQRLKQIWEHGSEDLQEKVDRHEMSVSAAAAQARKIRKGQDRTGRAEKLPGDDARTIMLRVSKLRYETERLTKYVAAHSLADFGAQQGEAVKIVQDAMTKLETFLAG